MSDRIEVASVRSDGAPQPGQQHRSSGNFSTDDSPSGLNRFEWQVSETEAPDAVRFDVMEDKSLQTDPVIFTNLTNGAQTDVKQARRLYIANPTGSNGGSFLVTVYAVS